MQSGWSNTLYSNFFANTNDWNVFANYLDNWNGLASSKENSPSLMSWSFVTKAVQYSNVFANLDHWDGLACSKEVQLWNDNFLQIIRINRM